MIRRLLAFAALIALGFVALHFAVGGDGQARERNATTEETGPEAIVSDPSTTTTRGRGISLTAARGSGEQDISLENLGGFSLQPEMRRVPLAQGYRELPLYQVSCQDSRNLPDGRVRMFDLEVKFFEVGGPALDPHEVHAGTMTASEAVAEIVRDARDGKLHLSSDKQMELTDVHLATTAFGSLQDANLTVAKVFARIGEERLDIATPGTEPFTLVLGGDRPATITGRGLELHAPTGGSDQGTLEMIVRRDPVLITNWIVDGKVSMWSLRSDGELRYREELSNGAAHVTMMDRVRMTIPKGMVDTIGAGEKAEADPVRISGDRLEAFLERRSGDDTRSSYITRRTGVWHTVRLTGAPAVINAAGLTVRSMSVVVVPGIDGTPYALSAIGIDTAMEYVAENGETTSFRAARNIHMVRPAALLAPIYSAFGIPKICLGAFLHSDLVIFEGAGHVEAAGGLTIDAANGLLVFRGREPGTELLVGLGQSTIRQERANGILLATGDAGFTLVRRPDGETTRDILHLGPVDRGEAAAWSLRKGNVFLEGLGLCRLERSGLDRFEVHMEADEPVIRGVFGRRLGTLEKIQSLDVVLVEGRILHLEATGPECQLKWTREHPRRGHETVTVTGRKITALDENSFRIEGTVDAPASLVRRGKVFDGDDRGALFLYGEILEVYRLSADDLVLDARSPTGIPARLVLDVDSTRPDAGHLHVDLTAKHIRMVPFAVSSRMQRAHTLGLDLLGPGLSAFGASSHYLFADGEVHLVQRETRADGAEDSRGEADGDRLVVALEGSTGALSGSPATVQFTDSQGRSSHAMAQHIRFLSWGDGEIGRLVPFPGEPVRFILMAPGEESRAPLQISTHGVVDLFPDRAECRSRTVIQPLDGDGVPDPQGIEIAANEVTVLRDKKTGLATGVDARGHCTVEGRSLSGRAEQIELDLVRKTCTVFGGAEPATLEIGNLVYRAHTLEANYESLSVRSWFGTLAPRDNRVGRSKEEPNR